MTEGINSGADMQQFLRGKYFEQFEYVVIWVLLDNVHRGWEEECIYLWNIYWLYSLYSVTKLHNSRRLADFF